MFEVQTGSDVLAARAFRDIGGKRIGFVGNHTSRLSDGTPTHASLYSSANVDLVRLFSPEHGAFGLEDREGIEDDVDPVTGLAIHSLYGETRKPTRRMLDGLDAIVFELQDVGARFYTYSSTLVLCLEAAFEAGVQLIVLDRPNPITGLHPEGPVADEDRLSFTACHTIPVRHGLTLGELALLTGAERGMRDAVTVIPCSGWRRSAWWDQTGIAWVNPSPAMGSLDSATVYPGVCLLEQTNVSVGRGTSRPFLICGAPWIDAMALSDRISETCGPGATIEPCEFTPRISKFAAEHCNGVRIAITKRDNLDSVRLGIAMIIALRDLHGEQFDLEGVDRLLANSAAQHQLRSGASADSVIASWSADLESWRGRTRPYLLYES